MQGLAIAKLSFEPFGVNEVSYEEIFKYFERVTVTNALIDSSKSFLIIAEVIWNQEPDAELMRRRFYEDLGFPDHYFRDLTEISRDGRKCIYVSRGQRIHFFSEIIETLTEEFFCFFEYPIVLTKEGITIQIVGSRGNIKKAMDFLSDFGLPLNLESVREYHVLGRAILSELTERQYECMKTAMENGYFEIPRRTDLRKLADKLGMRHGTLAIHLRKAQRTISHALFN